MRRQWNSASLFMHSRLLPRFTYNFIKIIPFLFLYIHLSLAPYSIFCPSVPSIAPPFIAVIHFNFNFVHDIGMNQEVVRKRRTVLITGCSRGIGLEVAKLFASKDDASWNVVATMRTPTCEAGVQLAAIPNVAVLPLDVTSKVSVDAAIAQVPGGVDVLINNAGYALVGAVELATEDQIMDEYNTNVFGCIRTMQAVLPAMRRRRSGVIVQLSSLVGKIAIPLNSMYTSTKFAIEGLCESSSMELMPYNIKMRIVQPGYVSTDFVKVMQFTGNSNITGNINSNSSQHDIDSDTKGYAAMLKSLLENSDDFMKNGSAPHQVAQVIYEAATSESEKLRWPVGEDAIEAFTKRPNTSDEEHIRGFAEKMKFFEAAPEM